MNKLVFALVFLTNLNFLIAQCPTLVYTSEYSPQTAAGYTFSQGWNLSNNTSCDAINYLLKEFIIQVSIDNGNTWNYYGGEYNLTLGTSSPSNQSDPFSILAMESNKPVEVHFNFTQAEGGKHYKIFFDIYSSNNIPLDPLPLGKLWTSFYLEQDPPPPTIANIKLYNLGAPAGVVAGNSLNLTGIIENDGTAATGPFALGQIWLSNNSTLSSVDDLLDDFSLFSMNPGTTSSLNRSVTIPASTPAGTYYLFAVMDATGEVPETNESDNMKFVEIQISLPTGSQPNLAPADMTVSSLINQGENIFVSFRTQNVSSNFMPYTSFTSRIFLSTNGSSYDNNDLLIGSRLCAYDLEPGEKDCYKSVSHPNSLSPGIYWILFEVDAFDDVEEQDDDDNMIAVSFKVRVPCVMGGPTANFSLTSPSEIMEGDNLSVSNSSNSATNYVWEIDNSSSSNSININNQPLYDPGSSAITLTAFDACDNDDTFTQYVTVRPDKSKPAPKDARIAYNRNSGSGGDPVDMASGAFVTKIDFFKVNDISASYPLAAYYTSTTSGNGGLGHKWTVAFDIRLQVEDRRFIVHWPDGHRDYYVRYQDDSAEPLYKGITDTLYKSGYYIIEKPNGKKYFFNSGSEPLLIQTEDRSGNKVYFSYNAAHDLRKVTLSNGDAIQYYYDSNNHLTHIEADDGRSVHFVVNGIGNFIQYVNVKGDTMSMAYDVANNITSQTDFKGTTTLINIYDSYSRVVQQIDAYNQSHHFAYNTPVADATTMTDPAGNTTVFYHDNENRAYEQTDALGFTTFTGYDLKINKPNKFTDELGNVSQIVFDNKGNPLHIINALGDSVSTIFDSFNLPVTFKNLLGGTTDITRDADGNPITTTLPNASTISNTYNSKGQLTGYTTPNGYNYSIAYDYLGNIASITTPSGVILFTRDLAGRVLSMTDRENNTTQFVWDEQNIIEIIDAVGASLYTSYDANDNLIYQVSRMDDTTFYSYDLRNRLIKITNALGEETQFIYNNLDLLTQVIDAKGNSIFYGYNARKELISSTNDLGTTTYNYNAAGDLISHTTAFGNTYTISYDPLHRPVSVINPLGEIESNVIYNNAGLPQSTTNGSGHVTTFEYSNMGWLTKATDNLNGTNAITLDNEGNVLTITNANGHTTTFTYNEFGQAITQLTAGGRTTNVTVNSEGYVTQVERPDGSINSFAYDQNFNVVSSTFPEDLYSWGYNANNEIIAMSNANGATSFERDALSRITKTTDPFNNVIYKGYDSVGNNIYTVYPAGDTLKTEFNSVGLATTISDWLGNSSIRAYNAEGLLTDITNSNGTSTQISYDDASHIISYKNLLANGDVLNQHNLMRLPGGLIAQEAITFSLSPNFLATDDTYNNNVDDELISTTTKNITYNSNGAKTITAGSVAENITWQELDLVKEYRRNDVITSNKYNAQRQRIERNRAGQTTRYALDVTNYLSQILEEHDQTNTHQATNIFAPDGLAWRLDETGNASFFHFDYIGHTKGLTNEDGEVTDKYAHSPFGDYLNQSGNSTQPFIFEGRFGITHEGEGHYQIRAREYDATTGRFWSKDALSPGLGNTQYSAYPFAANNPLSFVDVDGNMPLDQYSNSGTSTARERYYDTTKDQFSYRTIQTSNANIMSGNLPKHEIQNVPTRNFIDKTLVNYYSNKYSFTEGYRIGSGWSLLNTFDYANNQAQTFPKPNALRIGYFAGAFEKYALTAAITNPQSTFVTLFGRKKLHNYQGVLNRGSYRIGTGWKEQINSNIFRISIGKGKKRLHFDFFDIFKIR